MKPPDLDRLSLKELRALADRLEAEIARRRGREPVGFWSDPIAVASGQADDLRRFRRKARQ